MLFPFGLWIKKGARLVAPFSTAMVIVMFSCTQRLVTSHHYRLRHYLRHRCQQADL